VSSNQIQPYPIERTIWSLRAFHRVDPAICYDFEVDSTGTDVSEMRLNKQHWQSTSTDAKISIAVKSLIASAHALMRCNFEFDSTVQDGSEMQLEKHDLPSISTSAEI
jgi:hypothetical protein